MKQMMVILICLICLFFAGCSLLDQIAPQKLDEQGQPIPGSREPTALTKTIAGSVPYGDVALGLVLLLAAGVEKFKSARLEKGLKATLLAGKVVANDPEMKELWDKLKEQYRLQHDSAGVTSLIKDMIAKLPSIKQG